MGTWGLAQLPQLWAPGGGDWAACGPLRQACGSEEPAVPRGRLCWAGVARNLPPLVRRVLATTYLGPEPPPLERRPGMATWAHRLGVLPALPPGLRPGLSFGQTPRPFALMAPLLSQRGSYGLFCPLPGLGRLLQSLGCRGPGGRGHGGRGWVCHNPGRTGKCGKEGGSSCCLWSIAEECSEVPSDLGKSLEQASTAEEQ